MQRWKVIIYILFVGAHWDFKENENMVEDRPRVGNGTNYGELDIENRAYNNTWYYL